MTAPRPDGRHAARAIRLALEDAGIAPEEVEAINAHASSTPLNDKTETLAIKTIFGEHAYKLAVSSTKSATGHLLGAAGGLESGILALAVKNQILPPTINLDHPSEGCDLDFVPHHPRKVDLEYALTNSFGFGGTNGAVILKRYAT